MTATNSSSQHGGGGIVEVVDEVLSRDPKAAGLVINWHMFGSNGHETADYSKGVLERFTRRASTDWVPAGTPKGHQAVKTIINPRTVNVITNPHALVCFEGRYSVNEHGDAVFTPFNETETIDKIVINHYNIKSREEYLQKINRGRADIHDNTYTMKRFDICDHNEVFDDGILHYRDERAKTFRLPDKSRFAERLLSALVQNLSPTLLPTTPQKFYAGKMETFLTCREVAAYLKKKFADESSAKFFEEAALKAILKSAVTGMTFADAQLFIRELPNLLTLPYLAVKEIRAVAVQIISQLMHVFHLNNYWKNFVELNYILRLLQTWRPQ